jgi:hypothetical protein
MRKIPTHNFARCELHRNCFRSAQSGARPTAPPPPRERLSFMNPPRSRKSSPSSRAKACKVDHYAASDRPIFELIEGEGDKRRRIPLFSIPEILQKILEIGRRGVQIKRFKGLGEMNAKGIVRDHDESGKAQAAESRFER